MFVYLRGNKKQRRAVQKESPFPIVGIGGEMLWRSAAASLAVFDLFERRAQETSRPRSLHAESGRADFSLMFLRVSVSVC